MEDVIGLIRDALNEAADPSKAEPMRAYMKSEMPYLGIQTGPRRRICNEIFREHPVAGPTGWRDLVLALWRDATYREERYAALDLIGYTRYRKFNTPDCIPMYEEIIVTGAWWDYVDNIAVHRIGTLFDEYRDDLNPIMEAWSVDDNMWKRRTSIICQIQRRDETDVGLLCRCINPSIESKEFFLRKAIGWALRAYGDTNPSFVTGFVEQHEDRLSGLSKREALRKIVR